ncbi:MAG: hypothetical protein JKY60_03840 [Kordiimonadaceae bacterium]|nr:hypothetical protein [Kordiimonadaceae bacterium]
MTAESKNVTSDVTSNSAAEDQDDHRVPMLLKVIVVGLGLGIIGMLALIGYKIMAGGDDKAQETAVGAANRAAFPLVQGVAEPVEFGAYTVTRPAGSQLVNVSSASAEITFHFTGPDGDIIILLDRKTGRESRVTIAN